jgi:hypothetical protein
MIPCTPPPKKKANAGQIAATVFVVGVFIALLLNGHWAAPTLSGAGNPLFNAVGSVIVCIVFFCMFYPIVPIIIVFALALYFVFACLDSYFRRTIREELERR